MPRRLVNRAGGDSGVIATPTPTQHDSIDYEPPAFPLNDISMNKLGEISRTRDTLQYQNQIKDSLRHLGLSVYDLHERLQAQKTRLEQLQNRRNERGQEKQPEEERLEAHVANIESQIDSLTRKSESAVRKTIDRRNELEDEAVILGELYTTTVTNTHGRTRRETNQEDEDNAAPPTSSLDTLRAQRDQKRSTYDAIPSYQRYALDNDYAAFKKLWHDAHAGDDGPPLPDPSKWFRPDGTPVMTTTAGDADNDSDEDLAVAREKRSLTCPLTLRPLEEPYTNKNCNHTFEKEAIMDYLRSGNGPRQCPQTGCAEVRVLT